MSRKKILLPENQVDKYRKDWDTLPYRELTVKYGVSYPVLNRWAKEHKCTLPKKEYISNARITTPQGIIKSINPDVFENSENLKKMMEEFQRISRSNDLPPKEKDNKMLQLCQKIIVEYVSLFPLGNDLIEGVIGFWKLKLYEKKVSQGQEEQELDIDTLRSLKKRFIGEAFEDISNDLEPNQRKLFEALIQTATNKRLEQMRRAEEQNQPPMELEDGVAEGEIVG